MPILIAELNNQEPSFDRIVVIFVVMILAFFLISFLNFFFLLLRPWLRAFFAGTPIAMFRILAMRLRRSPVQKILDVGITASQAGHPIAWEDLERASLQGADLNLIADAHLILRERGEHYSIQELVSAYKDSRLQKMIE